jgi:hypothetical protein
VGLGWIAAREREILAEHLVSVGRRSATGRVAHLFLEFWARLRIRGIVTAPIFTVPVTQADVADALGLSVVHVNRTIKYLRHCGAIECHRHRIRILEIDALQKIAGFSEEFLLNHYAPGPIRHRVENLVAKFADTLGDGGEAYVQHTE